MQILDIVYIISILVLIGVAIWQHVRIADLEDLFTNPVTVNNAVTPSNAATIKLYAIERDKFPVGSPKHTAYENRIKELTGGN